MNESLLDPRLPAWINAIRVSFPDNIIFINSNGDAIGSERLRQSLAASGLDGIQINCYDGEKEFREKLDAVERWAREDSRVVVHYSGSLRRMSERNGLLNVRVKAIPSALPAFWNRGGHVPGVAPSGKYQGVSRCPSPFEQMYINYLGEVILCCCDYAFEVVLGSVVETSLADIWQGNAYRRCRERHMRKEFQDLPLCRSCNRITVDV
jgi:MoaA/NifB/PqqE/SkfB family radical SAM enzyme